MTDEKTETRRFKYAAGSRITVSVTGPSAAEVEALFHELPSGWARNERRHRREDILLPLKMAGFAVAIGLTVFIAAMTVVHVLSASGMLPDPVGKSAALPGVFAYISVLQNGLLYFLEASVAIVVGSVVWTFLRAIRIRRNRVAA